MQVQPYLFFDGNCEEAVNFYKKVLDAEVTAFMRYREMPEQPQGDCPSVDGEKVMHATLKIGDTNVMFSDGPNQKPMNFHGFSLSIALRSSEEADRYFAALAEGGQVHMPLTKTFWSPRFGMLADKFGVGWMINVLP